MSTFVSVGNAHQPFSRLLDAVDAIAPALPQPVFVQHGHTPFVSSRCGGAAFLEMSDFERRIADARLFIVQAGGGGILSALKCGKVPVIVPRRGDLGEHIDNHQVSWGRALAGTGRAVLVEDVADLAAAAIDALSRQDTARSAVPGTAMVGLVRDALLQSQR